QWYFGEQEEASIVTILLHPHKQGTSAELRHTNIPDEAYQEIVEGWNDVYFASLINFYED
ncbi:MAG TPA: SRPBCC domain-containing protein, partial [Ferruginibacter sp.]|nr:SRPBCC domain-containing protein [Ferruginibacter sp.]